MVYQLRRFVFNIINMSRIVKKPVSLLKYNPLPYYSVCRLEVNTPPSRQLSIFYPNLIKRLCDDWGAGLSGLACSSGDFRAALIKGDEISLGHIWAEIYCLCLDRVFIPFGGRHIHFSDDTKAVFSGMGLDRLEYRIVLSFSEPYPLEFKGIEYMVNGYLNDIMIDRPFPIQQRLKDFIDYRRDGSSSSL